MPLIYITGVSGTGKSTVLHELRRRGFEAHGIDEDGIADWVNRDSGKIVEFPHDDEHLDMHQWFKTHRWVHSPKRIGQLKKRVDTSGKTVFLCGAAQGDKTVWHYFDKVFALITDAYTVRQRIESRTDNRFGKAADELAEILDWHTKYEAIYQKQGALLVDATQPVKNVVDDILSQLDSAA